MSLKLYLCACDLSTLLPILFYFKNFDTIDRFPGSCLKRLRILDTFPKEFLNTKDKNPKR